MESNNSQYGIFSAIVRFFFMWNWRKARGISDAADRQFTRDAKGIGYAFDMAVDRLVQNLRGIQEGLSLVEVEVARREQNLATLNKKESTLIEERDGAIIKIEGAKTAEEVQKWTAYAAGKDAEILEVERRQTEEEGALKGLKAKVQELERTYLDLQRERKKLEEEKGITIAEFQANEAIVSLEARLQGLTTSFDRGPIDAVRKANAELSARAKVALRTSQRDVNRVDADLAAEARKASSEDRIKQMLAERAAKRGVATGEVPTAPAADRPTIGG